MSLFETGFAVDAHAPIAESSSASLTSAARKRKRPSTSAPGASTAEPSSGAAGHSEQNHVNLEKLMKKLQDGEHGSSRISKGKGKAKQNQNLKKHEDIAKPETSIQEPQESSKENEQSIDHVSPPTKQQQKPKNKKQKIAKPEKEPYIPDAAALAKREERQKKKAAQQSTNGVKGASAISADRPVTDSPHHPKKTVDVQESSKMANNTQPSGLTNLQKGLQKKLGGARFRWINEQLYTTSGEKAHELIREDPSMFEEYHSGFRSQAASWPSQPIQLFINAFLSSPSRPIIADLGCGDAQLAKTLSAQGFTVLSFDLIAANPWIVEAQCTKHVPLPGSDAAIGSNESEGAVVDVVVCCLSLMGHDWINMIKESRRILQSGGKLRIAEVSSRFSDIPGFIDLIQQVGFKLQSKDDSNTHFIIFEFAKVTKKSVAITAETEDGDALMERSAKLLKPCLYKKR